MSNLIRIGLSTGETFTKWTPQNWTQCSVVQSDNPGTARSRVVTLFATHFDYLELTPPRRNPPPQGARAPLFIEASLSHSDTSHSVGILWTSDQPVAETST